MPYRQVLVVWNTVSGPDTQEEDRKAVRRFLEGKGTDFEIRDWTAPEQIPDWVEEAEGGEVDLLVSAGGDGTAAAIADCLIRMGSRVPLAVLPLGSSNLLALSLGLPPSLEDALEVEWSGTVVRLDAGYVAEMDRHFLVGASVGAHAELVRKTSRERKREMGFLAYLLSGLRTVLSFRPRKVRIETDRGSWRWKTDSIEVLNTAGFLPADHALAPRVDPADGELDLMALRTGTLLDLAGLLLYALVGKRFDPWRTEHRQARRVTVRPRKTLEVQMDGEPAGRTPVTVEVRKSALSVVVAPG